MLSVNNISVGYKGLLAIQDVSFEVKKGEVVSLIGSNGAGKTTMLKTILGLLKPMKGEIRLNDQVISGRPAYDVVKMKISLVPEGRRLFPRLSVQDNLLLGAYTVDSKEQIAESLETVLRLFPWVKERADQRAGTLSGGEQQQVAIARGLMSRPICSCWTNHPWGSCRNWSPKSSAPSSASPARASPCSWSSRTCSRP